MKGTGNQRITDICSLYQTSLQNSSSEVFTVKAEMPISELKQLITEIAEKNYFKGSWEEWEKLPENERNY